MEKTIFFLPVVHLCHTVKRLVKKKKKNKLPLAHDKMLKGVLASNKH